MKILLLGYGIEGKSAERYCKKHFKDATIDVLESFDPQKIRENDYSSYDILFRSPSVSPLGLKNESSVTKYFFDHCPCKIIGVTGTKGKGTTCSLIKAILTSIGKTTYVVGNIGRPALDVLDDLSENDTIVYELSSFQLWDLHKSPNIAVVLRIEPDHLNVHKDYDDYVSAKANITKFQTENDSLIYFKDNQDSAKIANSSPAGHKLPYPNSDKTPELLELLDYLHVPGNHNKENAEAALLAVSALLGISLNELISRHQEEIKTAFLDFKPLPHHLEFVRELNDIKYYDDSFSASYPSLDVALKAFPDRKIVLIAGGKDRGLDLTAIKNTIFKTDNLTKAILIGETKYKLSENENPGKYEFAETLNEAVNKARKSAEETKSDIVLLSPGAASFDMFKDFYDRGDQFKEIVKDLK